MVKLTKDEIALRVLERESTNIWTWAGKPKEVLLSYCFDMAEKFLAESEKRDKGQDGVSGPVGVSGA